MTAPAESAAPPPDTLPRLLGGAIGLVFGVAAYWLMLQRGVDVLVVVGTALGLGVRRASRRPRVGFAAGTAVAAMAAGLLTLWWFRPFADDPSLGHFLAHLDQVPSKAMWSLLLSGLAGAWFGLGRKRRAAAK